MFGLLRDKAFLKILAIALAIAILYPLISLKPRPIHSARLKTQDIFFNIRHKLEKPPERLKDIILGHCG